MYTTLMLFGKKYLYPRLIFILLWRGFGLLFLYEFLNLFSLGLLAKIRFFQRQVREQYWVHMHFIHGCPLPPVEFSIIFSFSSWIVFSFFFSQIEVCFNLIKSVTWRLLQKSSTLCLAQFSSHPECIEVKFEPTLFESDVVFNWSLYEIL